MFQISSASKNPQNLNPSAHKAMAMNQAAKNKLFVYM